MYLFYIIEKFLCPFSMLQLRFMVEELVDKYFGFAFNKT